MDADIDHEAHQHHARKRRAPAPEARHQNQDAAKHLAHGQKQREGQAVLRREQQFLQQARPMEGIDGFVDPGADEKNRDKSAATWPATVFQDGMVREGLRGCAAVLAFIVLF